MTGALLPLSDRDLRELAEALRGARLGTPYLSAALHGLLSPAAAPAVAGALEQLREMGVGPQALAALLDLLRADRVRRPRLEDLVELVTTGPDIQASPTRDTGVVVRELFANAGVSVLVAGYAVYQGQRVFQSLADRMLEVPELQVRLFLDIQRPPGDPSSSDDLVARFAKRFRETEWPADRPLPEVFFDPRSLDLNTTRRACLHAKVVVVDNRDIFISSANFTEAAQHRNIEVGVRFPSPTLACQITTFFEDLLRHDALHTLRVRAAPPSSVPTA